MRVHRGSGKPPSEAFGAIAEEYDSIHTSQIHETENRLVFRELSRFLEPSRGCVRSRMVVDIGCGTGLLLDRMPIPPGCYVGTDVSPQMIEVSKRKHPLHRFAVQDMSDMSLLSKGSFTHAVSLFGSMSYCDDPVGAIDEMRRVLMPGGRFFLMLFGERYITRETHVMRDDGLAYYCYSPSDIRRMFAGIRHTIRGLNSLGDRFPSVAPRWIEGEFGTLTRVFPGLGYHLLVEGEI